MRFAKCHPDLTALGAVALFVGCSRTQLARIRSIATYLELGEGAVLIRQGADPKEFYVIINGAATVSIDTTPVGSIRAGQFFGEIDLLDRHPRLATVTAATTMTLLVFSTTEFRALIDLAPGVARIIMRTHVAHLRNAERLIARVETQLHAATRAPERMDAGARGQSGNRNSTRWRHTRGSDALDSSAEILSVESVDSEQGQT